MTSLSRTTAPSAATPRPLSSPAIRAPPGAPIDRLASTPARAPVAPDRVDALAPRPGLEIHGVGAAAAQVRAELDRAGGPRPGPLEGRLRALHRAVESMKGALIRQAGLVLEAADAPLAEAGAALRSLADRPEAPPELGRLADEIDFMGSYLLSRRVQALFGEARRTGPAGEAARARAETLLLDRAERLTGLLRRGGDVALRAAEAVLGPVPGPRSAYDASSSVERWQRARADRVTPRAGVVGDTLFYVGVADAVESGGHAWSRDVERELARPELDPVEVLRAVERRLGAPLRGRDRLMLLERLERLPPLASPADGA